MAREPRSSSFDAFQRATAALHQRRAQERRALSDQALLDASVTTTTEVDRHGDGLEVSSLDER